MTMRAAAFAAICAAAAASAGAYALEGGYKMAGQESVFTFGADGFLSGTTPDGAMIHEAYKVDGDTVTFTAADDHPQCPGAVGVYTFEETDDGMLTFTLVSDSCEARVQGMTAGPWAKAE